MQPHNLLMFAPLGCGAMKFQRKTLHQLNLRATGLFRQISPNTTKWITVSQGDENTQMHQGHKGSFKWNNFFWSQSVGSWIMKENKLEFSCELPAVASPPARLCNHRVNELLNPSDRNPKQQLELWSLCALFISGASFSEEGLKLAAELFFSCSYEAQHTFQSPRQTRLNEHQKRQVKRPTWTPSKSRVKGHPKPKHKDLDFGLWISLLYIYRKSFEFFWGFNLYNTKKVVLVICPLWWEDGIGLILAMWTFHQARTLGPR